MTALGFGLLIAVGVMGLWVASAMEKDTVGGSVTLALISSASIGVAALLLYRAFGGV